MQQGPPRQRPEAAHGAPRGQGHELHEGALPAHGKVLAVRRDGDRVHGADVAETTWTPFAADHADAVPVRLIVRRVRPSPGTQLALFSEFTYHPFITDREGDTLELEADHLGDLGTLRQRGGDHRLRLGVRRVGEDPAVLADARRLARRTRRNIMQNFGWAAGYNILAIPFAAAGLIPPWGAAIGMSLSSLVVVVNALRLQKA